MNITCQCGTKLKVSDETMGRKVRCPSCQAVFTAEAPLVLEIQEPIAAPPPPPPALPPEPFQALEAPRPRSRDRDDDFDRPRPRDDDRRRRDEYVDDRRPLPTSGKAIASLICGLAGLFFCVPSIAGFILGWIALGDCKRRRVQGRGLAISGIVVSSITGLVLPGVIGTVVFLAMQDAAAKLKSINNLKELSLAIHKFHDANKNKLPPNAVRSKTDGKPLLSWRVLLLPHIGEGALYKEFKLDEPWDSPHNIKLLPRMPKVYAPPGITTKEPYTTYYQVFVSPEVGGEEDGGFQRFGQFSSAGAMDAIPIPGAPFGAACQFNLGNMPDGTSNTIGIIEAADPVPWSKPADIVYDPARPIPRLGGLFPDRINAGLMDGSARIIRRNISEQTMRNAICPNDYNVLGWDW